MSGAAASPIELELLRLVRDAGGCMSHDDRRLEKFCAEGSPPDTFNLCHDYGWLNTKRDDRTESSSVWITRGGRQQLGELT